VVPKPEPGFEELKEIKAKVAPKPEKRMGKLKEIKAKVVPKPEAGMEELKAIKAEVLSGVKAVEEKVKETDFSFPMGDIRDVLREKGNVLTIKILSGLRSPAQGPDSMPEQLISKRFSADEHVLNEVERKLVMNMDGYTFDIHITPAQGAEVPSTGKGAEPEKGHLKMTTEALWIIGRADHERIAWDDVVNVEQKRRSVYQGTEYAAISIDHHAEGDTTKVTSTIVITKGTITEDLLKRARQLLAMHHQKK